MIAGTLEIQLLANMARLQSDMDKAKRTVSGAVDTMNKVLGTIGVGVSLAGITSMIKSVTDTGDKLNDLRKISGLAIEELGGLGKVAAMSGSNLDTVAKAVGVMSKNMYAGAQAFDVLGIATKDADGNLRSANQVLLDVADRFSRMQDGAQKSAIANQLFGKSGRELIPLLNEGRAELEAATQAYAAHSGMTLKVAEDSDRFNDILTMLGGRVTAIKTSFVAELLPTLNAIGNAMLATSQSTNQFSLAANVAVPVLKGLAIGAFTVVDTFRGMGREIGARAAQLVAFANMDFSGAKFIGAALAEDNAKSRAEYDKFVKTILDSDKAVSQLTETQKEYLKIEQQVPSVVEKTTKALKEKKVLTDAEQLAILRTNESTKATIALAQKVESITDSVATEQERYNQKLEELDRLKPYLSVETYNRALQKAQDELSKTAQKTVTTTDEVSQLWMQAGRNIQSTLANSIFNFFDDGLKGMLKNVVSTVGRIASEFAALKIAQGVGLAGIFGGASGIANAADVAGGSGSILGRAASLGSSAFNLIRGGGASLLSTGANALGFTSFGAGASGAASAGVFGAGGLNFLGGAGTALGTGAEFGVTAALGASMAAIAGPLIAVDIAGRLFGGNKTLGGAEMIPVIGGFLAGLFGHGPLKFRQQSLQGEVSSSGFDGDLTNVFRAKGGLLVGNKHKSITEQLSDDQQASFDAAITGFYKSTRSFAENLGLSTDLVDNYTQQVQIKSEKGKQLTEEAITNMLSGIGDSLAKNLMPNVDEFRKVGESSAQTLSRLSGELTVLTGASQLLFNQTAAQSKAFINQFSFGDRTAFLDKAGGADAFGAMVAGFAQNFLSDNQRMRPVIESLVSQRDALKLSGINTREQYVAAVQSGKLSADQLEFLLKSQAVIKDVFDYLDRKTQETTAIQNQTLDAGNIYGGVIANFNRQVQKVTDSIETLKNFSQELTGTVQQLQPMSRNEALQKLFGYATAARKGADLPDIATLRTPLNTLTSMNVNDYASQLDYARARAQSVNAVRTLIAISGDKQEKLAAQIVAMKEAFADSLANIAKYTGQTAQILDSTTAGGGPMLTQQA